MEKISRILPPSRRVTAVDTESSQPVRPGAPNQGRPMAKPMDVDVQDRVSLSSLANNRAPEQNITYSNPKERARAKAVDELAEKFFNPRTFAKDGDSTLSEDTLKSMENNDNFQNIAAKND